jgi:hypothetical protein
MWKSEQGVEECDEALQAFFFFYYNVFIQLLALANQNHILELCLLIIYISNVFQYLNFFFFFWWDWGLNSGFHACKVGVLPLEQASSPFALVILDKLLP